MLKGKKILLGVTGSIAAYKSAVLVRLLVKAGAEVRVINTPAANQFVAPLTLSTLSKNQVLSELSDNDSWSNHVMLGRWADVMLIAPLSCNTLAKMAHGTCDNLLMAVYLSATCQVVVAPAMDEDMWYHHSTQDNLLKIQSYQNAVIPVDTGELASGLFGPGRMAEPAAIVDWLTDYFKEKDQLAGKKILITAGPTHESIDPVRFIGNHSSGKMGIALAEACYKRGAEVTLVVGPVTEPIPSGLNVVAVRTAAEMYDACMKVFPEMDIAILAAAVADYAVSSPADHKIKKKEAELTITLSKTKDILKQLGTLKKPHQFLIGFALETDHEKEHALQKLQSKNADMIVMNSLNDPGAGFGHATNKITIFDRQSQEYTFEVKSKKEVATDIIHTMLRFLHA
jgi:phosphopantothenoylcysteine decarboxylase/phosphopantothenate--cysteine ligase